MPLSSVLPVSANVGKLLDPTPDLKFATSFQPQPQRKPPSLLSPPISTATLLRLLLTRAYRFTCVVCTRDHRFTKEGPRTTRQKGFHYCPGTGTTSRIRFRAFSSRLETYNSRSTLQLLPRKGQDSDFVTHIICL